MVYLALTYSSILSIPIRIRLYKNSENIIGEDNHLSWVLHSESIHLTDILMKNIYIGPGPDIPVPPAISPQYPLHPVEPFTTTTQYNIIDNSMNIYGNLYNTGNLRVDGDTQLQDTDICGNLYVDLDASFNQSVHIKDTLDVSNNANIQNDLTVRGNLDVSGNIRGSSLKIDVNAVIGNDMDVLNSLDIGQNQRLTLTENTILSTTASSNFYTGLRSEANNFYFKVNTAATGQGFVLNLQEQTSNKAFKIIDISGGGNSLFKVDGSGLTNTQDIHPFINNTYDIGYKSPSNPNADFRYNNLYVNNVDTNTLDTNTLITDDISANKFYQKLSGSSLLDFSSINITPSGSLNYYDIAYLVNPADVSGNKLTQGSALIEIYLVEYATNINSLDKIEYLKCEISEFRASTASITVISAGNIPDSSDRILKSLKLNYGFNNSVPPYFDPGALFQVGLEDSTSTTQKLFCRIYENNPVDSHQTGTSVIVNIEEGKWDLALSGTSNNSPTFGTPAQPYESNYMVDLDFNPNGGTTTQPLSGGKLMYVNDKDSKFTSNVRFVEDVNFNKDINVDSDITATNLYVNDIYNTTPPLNIDICGNVYELTKTELNLNNKNIQNVSELNTTANSDLTVGNNSSNVTFDCDVSMNKLNVNILEVEKTNGDDVFKVDAANNTANLDIPLNLYRDTITNIQSGSKALSNYSIGIVNNIGSSVDATNTYQTDALAWKPNISGTTQSSLIVNEQTVHIYNRQLTGNSSNGGIDPNTSTSDPIGTLSYKRYDSSGGTERISFFGCMPTSNDGAASSFPISSKLHFMRKTWITGIYLNSPFNDEPDNATSGNIFAYGNDSYIDLEIGSSTTKWTRVYRLGNANSGSDSYGFPASASYDSSTGGIRIVLAPDDWIYIPEGTNISQCVRFKYYVNDKIWVIDEASATSYHESQIDGYLTYIQKPLVVL
jgi:cytoskeletal protein CcmA (bactofilin family)